MFNRKFVHQARNRAAVKPDFEDVLFLRDGIERSLMERLRDLTYQFEHVLIIDARVSPAFCRFLMDEKGARQVTIMDGAQDVLSYARKTFDHAGVKVDFMQQDEEFLPFEAQSFDMIIGGPSLQSVNDLPGVMIQARRALKPDGLFLLTLAGGQTLSGLKQVMLDVETAIYSGAAARIHPFADRYQIAALMQRAGFALPVIDSEVSTIEYRDAMRLFQDLHDMGESCALNARQVPYRPRRFFESIAQQCHEQASGNFLAAFEIIFASGWSPDQSKQQQPKKRGSAEHSLTEIL